MSIDLSELTELELVIPPLEEIPAEERLLYLGKITTRIKSVLRCQKTLDSIVTAGLDSGMDYTTHHVRKLMEHLDAYDRELINLYAKHDEILLEVVNDE